MKHNPVFEPTRGCDEPLFPLKPLLLFSSRRKKTPLLRTALKIMVEMKGLEPSTPTLRTWCSPS